MSAARRVAAVLGRIHTIDHDDAALTRATWADRQPVRRLRLGRRELVVSQPSSTVWVYALGVLTCAVAFRHGRLVPGDDALRWWSAGWWLWGVGALLAGTSYQALGYHLKCRDGRVRWTNWLEATYMLCQQLSIDALLVATALLATGGWWRVAFVAVAGTTAMGYTISLLVGAFRPHRGLLSFEWMAAVSAPAVGAMLAIHAVRAVADGGALDWALAGVWLGLVACMVAYVLYLRSGLTQRLWARGRWFSENDVLHVCLVAWMLAVGSLDGLLLERVG